MLIEALSVIPEVFSPYLDASIMGRAQKSGVFEFAAHDLRNWTHDRHRTVDDAPFGGGPGMLMKPAPIFEALDDICSRGPRPHVVFFSPCGARFDQRHAERLATKERILCVCGRYEGIDERVLEEIVTDYVSIGDYVLTGGELPAMVMVDAISRLVPGVLHNDVSAEFESFQDNLLERGLYNHNPHTFKNPYKMERIPKCFKNGKFRFTGKAPIPINEKIKNTSI